MVDATFGVWSWPQLNCKEARNMPRHYVSCKQIFGRYINHYYFAFLLELPYLKIFLICSYLLSVYWSIIKRPTDSTTSTTSGQTDTTSGQTDTTSGQTSTTSGKTSTTSGKTSTASEKTSTESTTRSHTDTRNHQTSFVSTKSGVVSSTKRVTL